MHVGEELSREYASEKKVSISGQKVKFSCNLFASSHKIKTKMSKIAHFSEMGPAQLFRQCLALDFTK